MTTTTTLLALAINLIKIGPDWDVLKSNFVAIADLDTLDPLGNLDLNWQSLKAYTDRVSCRPWRHPDPAWIWPRSNLS